MTTFTSNLWDFLDNEHGANVRLLKQEALMAEAVEKGATSMTVTHRDDGVLVTWVADGESHSVYDSFNGTWLP